MTSSNYSRLAKDYYISNLLGDEYKNIFVHFFVFNLLAHSPPFPSLFLFFFYSSFDIILGYTIIVIVFTMIIFVWKLSVLFPLSHLLSSLFPYIPASKYKIICAFAQFVIRRLLNTEARVQFQGGPCGICAGEGGNGTHFFSSFSRFSCQWPSNWCSVLMSIFRGWCHFTVPGLKDSLL